MDRLLEKLWAYVAKDEPQTVQIRLFRLFCLATGILCLAIVMPANAFQALPREIQIGNVLLGLIALFCFWRSIRGRNHVLGFFVVVVLMLDPAWFLNGGTDGSITYFFFPLALYPMTLFRGRTRWVTTIGLMLNTCALLVLDRLFPSLTTPFRTSTDRLLDLTSGVFCAFVVLAIVLWVIIANYDWERNAIARVAKELEVSEAKYRSVVENAKSIILRVDPKGNITFFNRFAEDLFGHPRDHIQGKPLLGTIVPRLSQKGEDQASPFEQLLKQPARHSQGETEALCRNGQRLQIIWTYQPIFDDRQRLQEILCVGSDVTDRAALLEQLQLIQRTVDAAPDQIVWVDETGHIFYANAATSTALGYNLEELRALTFEDISVGPFGLSRDARLQALKRDGSLHFEGLQRRKDGATFPVDVTATYLQIGKKTYTAAIVRDIRARKQAEDEAERAHRQLVDMSHQAGMAEVAITVLHNVGNVLNSANISASIIVNSVRRSRLGSLAQLADLFSQHSHDLASFITEDKRGQKIPHYLQRLSLHLNGYQELLLKETKALMAGIEHIKEIVAAQQSSTRVLGIIETVSLTALMEDALRMTGDSIARKNIRLAKDFASVPPATLDKHKTLQIVVNLLRNAQHACVESTSPAKLITLRVQARTADRVAIEVEDTGVGITPENLKRIFTFGFTTRKEGHGFGLHSAALTAKEMGGSLTVHSDGLGKGARFTLELPLQAPNRPKRFSAPPAPS
jgi:PAS domain S-box-containing protein